ncbi:sigma-70 family RNA polymerase sigma factor [Frankia sp. Mgl5]|uniref:RNA polymerase sigma factor n=1 Tax=Frankia sp. Mgl5 TaxID=2933793 RepID=UPI002036077A|nr:sigma-70 family RNA polymerase sigma factor [Frankia sp. Mgl5]
MPTVHGQDGAAPVTRRPSAAGTGGGAPTPATPAAARQPLSRREVVELHGRLVAGDPTALAVVHERYARYLLAVATRVTGDADAARDVLQEVLVAFWQHPLRFDPDRGELRTWLAVLAHRRAVDWVRREIARRPTDLVARALAEQSDGPAADRDFLAREDADAVRAAVAALPVKLREVVELAYYRELTYREVAIRLAIPEGTAKSRMRAALSALALALTRLGAAP